MMYAMMIAGALASLLPGCRQPKDKIDRQIVARVGDRELSLAEVKGIIDTTQGPFETQLRSYVTHWINTELIYQEATRQGTETSGPFKRELQDVTRQLVNQFFLEHELYADSGNVDEPAMQAYFTAHAQEFPIREKMIRLNIIVISTRERASAFAAKVSRGTSWKVAADNLLQDSLAASSIRSISPGQYYTSHTLFPQEFWKVAQALNPGDVSFPVKTPLGYAVIEFLGSVRQGQPATYELARDEVRQRLLMEQRRRQYNELLGTLRKRYAVQVFMGSTTSMDSVHAHE